MQHSFSLGLGPHVLDSPSNYVRSLDHLKTLCLRGNGHIETGEAQMLELSEIRHMNERAFR